MHLFSTVLLSLFRCAGCARGGCCHAVTFDRRNADGSVLCYWMKVHDDVQVCRDKSDWSFAKNYSALSLSDLHGRGGDALSKRGCWLPPFAFSLCVTSNLTNLGSAVNPSLPCIVWCSKHLLTSKVSWVRLVTNPNTYVSPQIVARQPFNRFLTLFGT